MDDLDRLVQNVRQSPRYVQVCPALVRRIGARELALRRDLKEAIKATKGKLHQIGGAYLETNLPYERWLHDLQAAVASADSERLRSICREVMCHHSSTREREPILQAFYAQTLAGLSPIRTVLDVACGFNPLAIPWMSLPSGCEYYAYDIYADMMTFVSQSLGPLGMTGAAEVCDVTDSPPTREADLALLLKVLPCVEQLERGADARLLDALRVRHLLVSFPVRSLGGRDKGMLKNYAIRFADLMADRSWSVQRFEFATELAFVIHKF